MRQKENQWTHHCIIPSEFALFSVPFRVLLHLFYIQCPALLVVLKWRIKGKYVYSCLSRSGSPIHLILFALLLQVNPFSCLRSQGPSFINHSCLSSLHGERNANPKSRRALCIGGRDKKISTPKDAHWILWISSFFLSLFFSPHLRTCLLILERERKGGRETPMSEISIGCRLHVPLPGTKRTT